MFCEDIQTKLKLSLFNIVTHSTVTLLSDPLQLSRMSLQETFTFDQL